VSLVCATWGPANNHVIAFVLSRDELLYTRLAPVIRNWYFSNTALFRADTSLRAHPGPIATLYLKRVLRHITVSLLFDWLTHWT
jgi:hypothetical protein